MEIQKADRKVRHRALLGLGVLATAIAGIVLLIGQQTVLVTEIKEVVIFELASTPHLLTLASVVILSPVWFFAALVLRYSRRVVSADRFPLANDRLIRDTRILRGQSARRMACLLKCLAIALSLCAATIVVCVFLLAQSLR